MGEVATVRLVRLFASVDRRLTWALVAMTVLRGLFFPVLTVASGALVAALTQGSSPTAPLVVVIAVFAIRRILDPLVEDVGGMLARRTDEALSQRIMAAMVAPLGMAHLEDPVVRDRISQAQGALTGATPGEAAPRMTFVWADWLQGGLSLAIVARTYPLLAVLLAATYVIGHKVARLHWLHVTLVMYGRTDELRRSHYLRTLALTAGAAKETRVFGLAGWLVDQYRQSSLGVMRSIWAERNEAWLRMLGTTALISATEAVTLVLLGRDAAHGAIGIGLAVATAQAVLAAARLATFQDGHWVMSEAVRALDLLAALDDLPSPGAVGGAGRMNASGMPTRLIRFEDVHFTYPGSSSPVFAGLSFDIEAGRSLAIVGENGAGKTTLIKLLAGLYEPTGGRITVDGIDLRELDLVAWRRRLAAVFQDYVQFELSARDNVAFGEVARDWSDEELDDVAAAAGATRLIGRLEHGWDTALSRQVTGGTQLSGGEWQRLALARAMLSVRSGAGVLVLDEPTAAMDVRGEAEIYDRFLELTHGLTTIVVSHRFSTVRRADRIVVIEHGVLVEDGDHHSLLRDGGRYARMYRLQAARFLDA